MTFERQPKQQPQESEMQNEVHEYYGVRNGACHCYTIETIDGGETWFVTATGNVHNEAWKAEAELENEMINRGYQVFYSIEEAEEYLRELDQDVNPGLNPPQEEETSEERIARYRAQLSQPCDETPEEKELLDTVERLILSPRDCVYYDGTSYSLRKRSWADICLASHYEDNLPCRVVDLDEWNRRDALDAIRSLHERLETV